jgi:methylated-DNA-[protein]-cysteine S-methyltransferase
MTVTVGPALGISDEWTVIATPVGEMMVIGDDEALHFLHLPDSYVRRHFDPDRAGRPATVVAAVEQIDAYFSGDLKEFSLPLDPAGTDFQRRVWLALADIAYGATESYGELAVRIGNPKACRAVGLANGRNPNPLVLPCPRVIGANGRPRAQAAPARPRGRPSP